MSQYERAVEAFKALRADVEQFDNRESQSDSDLFSAKVPLPMKSYLVNWLREFTRDHGDVVEEALLSRSNEASK
jgi:hypothetical protein